MLPAFYRFLGNPSPPVGPSGQNRASAVIEFEWPAPQKVNRMLLQEYIPLGQRVQSFVVEYNKEGEWLPVKLNEETTTIGYKRLLRFETVTTDKLRVNFEKSRACLCINNIEA